MASTLRIAILAHGHPSVSPGGAEIAAHTLHASLCEASGVASLHIACGSPRQAVPARDNREQILEAGSLDAFRLSNSDSGDLSRLMTMLASFNPDVIHLHHILGFGADALFAIRERFPSAAMVVTFHEFIAICHHQGQMVRTDGETLCERATATNCHGCFPDIAPASFLRREHALRALLLLADGYIAPSQFLARRYIDWGLPASRMSVIENAIPPAEATLPSVETRSRMRGQFAFFGQITPFKGLDVLLDAVAAVPASAWEGCSLSIHGGNLHKQPPAFQERMQTKILEAVPRARFHGAYRNEDLPSLMADIDWVVVPSVWWENSPIVIQEAFRHGRPVIASRIGGMAEKVVEGQNGLTFDVGDADGLSQRLQHAIEPALWERLRDGIRAPVDKAVTAREHLDCYRALIMARRTAATPAL